MLLDVKERTQKVESTPTLQCRVNDFTFEKFGELSEHYKCAKAELLRALIDNGLKRHKEVI